MTDSRRSSSKRRDKSNYHEDSDENRYMDLLHEVKIDKSHLEREIEALQEKREARKEKAKYLLQEIDMLKETLTSLRKNKEVSIRRLTSELERLRQKKYESMNDVREQKRDDVLVRPKRASVS